MTDIDPTTAEPSLEYKNHPEEIQNEPNGDSFHSFSAFLGIFRRFSVFLGAPTRRN